MNWENEDYLSNLIHIHGTADKIFPIKNIRNVIEIPTGGHFMIVNKASQIEQLIFDLLKNL
ncbi:alpha/beta hydrolase [Pedobacter polaris]|uniref:Alpha/beta hydrolase n=1 Tax=Pedobacter polaris TaxID=2571273 RepID=A0A4U1CVJ4_9SPHI|nr:alpha/beta hydrolase [Pedobacter polaris]TKC12863.1 alpha/beta hydrolase [Pedobacter polaris]